MSGRSMKGLLVHSSIYGLGEIINDPPWNKKKDIFLGHIEVKYYDSKGDRTYRYSVAGVPIGGKYPTCQILKSSNWQTLQMDLYYKIKK